MLGRGGGGRAGVKEHAARYLHSILHASMYVVLSEGEYGLTKIFLTLALHPHFDVTGKIASTSIVTEISDISPALYMFIA